MLWVDITKYSPENHGTASKLLARALFDGQVVRLEGDLDTVASLGQVFDSVRGKWFVPAEGESYLLALARVFRTYTMMASDVQAGTPPAAVFS